MKQILFSLLILISPFAYAGENFSVEKELNRKLGLEIYRFYSTKMNKAAREFNSRQGLNKKQTALFKKTLKYNPRNITFPKAVYHKGKIWFNVGDRKVEIHMDSLIDRTILVGGQKVVIGHCNSKSACIKNFARQLKLTKKKTSFLSLPFLSNAVAAGKGLDSFELTDYKIIAAMMAMDDDLEDAGGMLKSKDESRAIRNKNFSKILAKFKPMKEKCESESWNIDDENDPGIHRFNDMAGLMKKIAEFSDLEEQDDYVKEKLGDNPTYYNKDQKGSRAALVNYFYGSTTLHWKNYISCEGVQKLMLSEAKLGYITDLATTERSQNEIFDEEACENFNELKECLIKYHTTAKNLYQGKGKSKMDEDDKEFFEEEVYDVIKDSVSK